MSMMDHFSAVTFPWGRKPPTLEEILKVTRRAEELGFYSMNIPLVDTIMPRAGGPFSKYNNQYTLDALALLPAMVAATKKMRIAVDAAPLFQLPPFGWAKYFASLDVISGGRLIAGMCLGLGEASFNTVGMRVKDRGRIADEQLDVITRLWTQDNVTHDGKFYHLKNVSLDPKPIQKPYPPIWWGGRTKSIPRAARYCEYLNTLWPTVEEVRKDYLPFLKQETKKWGTKTRLGTWLYCRITPRRKMSDQEIDEWFANLMEMEVKVVPSQVTMAGSPEQCAAKIKAYVDAGMDHFVLDFQRHGLEDAETNIKQMEQFVDKVVPHLE